ncbi:MAG: tetratricopeptide repeat protein [Methylomonas sp.]|nr:tetratricopeptide repeat protein [Methylomonas sp.]
MKNKPLLICLPLFLLAAGCSTAPERQPAPIAKAVTPKPPAPPKPPAKKPAPPVVKKQVPETKTYAIDDGKSTFKVEPSVPAFKIDPLAPPVEVPGVAAGVPATTTAMTGSMVQGIAPLAAPAPVVPVMPAVAIEDVALPAGSSPAVIALLSEADRNRAAGDLDTAVMATERALRIDSRNPALTYKLAQLRIKQAKPQLAEELAGKAALLAGNNLDLKRKSWLLIAEARRMQQNYQGAKEAKAKAEGFFGR